VAKTIPHYAFRKTDVPGSADTFLNLVCHRYLNLVLVVPVLPGGTARGTQVLNLVLDGSFVRDLDGCSRVHPVCILVLRRTKFGTRVLNLAPVGMRRRGSLIRGCHSCLPRLADVLNLVLNLVPDAPDRGTAVQLY
jgi:hypothetical protein